MWGNLRIQTQLQDIRDALGEYYDQAVALVVDILEAADNTIQGVMNTFVEMFNDPTTLLRAFLDFLIPPAYGDEINLNTKNNFDSAQRITPPRRDPLVLDLDADGLETTGLNATNPVLFDHDGDGIKTGTGWVSAHDAFLVLDRNGNGVIDNGRELFGDSTLLANGSTAADGFAALAEQDTNAESAIAPSLARGPRLDSRMESRAMPHGCGVYGFDPIGETSQLADVNLADDTSECNGYSRPNELPLAA